MKIKCYYLFVLIFFPSSLLLASALSSEGDQQSAIFDRSARFHPVHSEAGMVVSQEAIASKVGADILSQGGNAIDAAVATGFALAATLPQAGNLGGGGFMMVYLAESHKTVAIDYREMAPAAADKTLFLDRMGNVDTKSCPNSFIPRRVYPGNGGRGLISYPWKTLWVPFVPYQTG